MKPETETSGTRLDRRTSIQGHRKRLALFFDGTWNEPPDHTNVRRLHLMLAEQGADGVQQRAFYDAGVGTRWQDRITGGLFGTGLSANVRSGYRWLTENYDPGDDIFIFGFSRGAFTARSLAGLIARCGLLEPNSSISFSQLFEIYQRGDAARAIYEIIRLKNQPEQLDFEERVLLKTSRYSRNLIKMVGAWDTVGSIGVPFGNIKGISRRTLHFHNTRLSRAIEHSYHAVAIDEARAPYSVLLWTEFFPEAAQATSRTDDERFVEQRWFSGAHANVGGGYRDDFLPDRPLVWMQEKACALGLQFRSFATVSDDELDCVPVDSYSQFLRGLWKVVTLGRRFTRPILADSIFKSARAIGDSAATPGWVQTANERIDRSVFVRCQRNPRYRPAGLCEWAARNGLRLEEVITDPDCLRGITEPVTLPGVAERPPPHDMAGAPNREYRTRSS